MLLFCYIWFMRKDYIQENHLIIMKKRIVDINIALQKQRKLSKFSEITLLLNTYDDLFSDFDPRPFSERALSDDFLEEAKKATRDKFTNGIELIFLIPKHLRKLKDEEIIKRRLKEHFVRHSLILHHEKRSTVNRGLLFIAAGILLMTIIVLILYDKIKTGNFSSLLIILFELPSWFLFWEGLNQIIFEVKKLKPNLDFYTKMANCDIEFYSV